MKRQESADEICSRIAPDLGAAILREKPNGGYRWKGRHSNLVIVVTSRDEPEVIDMTVPPEVRPLRESYREVYKVLVEVRAEVGLLERVGPLQVTKRQQANFDRDGVERFASEHTTNHAFAELETARAVHWTRSQGWLVGPAPVMTRPVQQQIDFGTDSLPSSTRQTERPCSTAGIAHASRVARDSIGERVTRGPVMLGKREIWIPGEKWPDTEGGLVIEDTSEKTHFAEGPVKKISYEGRIRTVRVDAVRAELVSVDDRGRTKTATVKIVTPDGRRQITVPVLGDWQLEGKLSDSEELSELTSSN